MWVVILIGLVLEGIAIGFAVSEDGLLFYSWIASIIAAFIVRFAFYVGHYKVPFWLILLVFLAVSHLALAIKVSAKNRVINEAKRKNEESLREAHRLEQQREAEDEKRIIAHISGIRASKKYLTFREFFSVNISLIALINVGNGIVRLYIPRTKNLFVPDYQQGKMIIDSTRGYEEHSFFGNAQDEREWTVFEAEALARIIDEDLRATGLYSLTNSNAGLRNYIRIAPSDPVIAKTPY